MPRAQSTLLFLTVVLAAAQPRPLQLPATLVAPRSAQCPATTALCATLSEAGAGTPLCTWALSASGRYANAGSGLCLAVWGAGGAPGSAVVLAHCGVNASRGVQDWTWVGAEMDGGLMFLGEARDQECVTGVDPTVGPPSQLVLAPCAFTPWQQLTSDSDGNGTLSLSNLPGGAPPLYVCSPPPP